MTLLIDNHLSLETGPFPVGAPGPLRELGAYTMAPDAPPLPEWRPACVGMRADAVEPLTRKAHRGIHACCPGEVGTGAAAWKPEAANPSADT